MHRLLAFLFVFGFWSLVSANQDREGSIEGDKPMIQIRVISQLHHGINSVNRAYHSPLDEYYKFVEALGESLEPLKIEYELVFKRFPAKIDPEYTCISLYLHEWSLNRGGIIDARFSARLELDGEKTKLGSFRGDSIMGPSSIRSLRERSFAEAVEEAGEDFLEAIREALGSKGDNE